MMTTPPPPLSSEPGTWLVPKRQVSGARALPESARPARKWAPASCTSKPPSSAPADGGCAELLAVERHVDERSTCGGAVCLDQRSVWRSAVQTPGAVIHPCRHTRSQGAEAADKLRAKAERVPSEADRCASRSGTAWRHDRREHGRGVLEERGAVRRVLLAVDAHLKPQDDAVVPVGARREAAQRGVTAFPRRRHEVRQ
eukprot:6554728-Prymnesium_polylepis.2